jgi:hypothetical protein
LVAAFVTGAIVCGILLVLSRATRPTDVLNEPFDLEDDSDGSLFV